MIIPGDPPFKTALSTGSTPYTYTYEHTSLFSVGGF